MKRNPSCVCVWRACACACVCKVLSQKSHSRHVFAFPRTVKGGGLCILTNNHTDMREVLYRNRVRTFKINDVEHN